MIHKDTRDEMMLKDIKDAYSLFLRQIILKIQQIEDNSRKNQSITELEQILRASFSGVPVPLIDPNTSNIEELVGFANLVETRIMPNDYLEIQDLLLEKSDMIQSVGIQFQNTTEVITTGNDMRFSSCVAAAEDALTIEEQSILTSISGPDPDNQLPYFLPTQQQIVIDYIRARHNYFKAVLLSREMHTAQNQCDNLINRFRASGQEGISLDSEQRPHLFTKINNACAEIGRVIRRGFVADVIKDYPIDKLEGLDSNDFFPVYASAVNISNDLQAVNNMLEYFTETKAKLTTPLPTIRFTAEFFGDLKLNRVCFTLTVPDLLMGYTIHNMLLISQQTATGEKVYTPYNGEKYFILDKKSLADLKKYLIELKTWYADFEAILASLFGDKDTVAQYTNTGQKSLAEIIKIDKVRIKSQLKPFITEATIKELDKIPRPELRNLLLIGQSAVDLTNHPDRDGMRSFLEEIYQQHDLKDAKGDRKTFIKAVGYEYVSLLSISNIQAILADLMAQAGLTAIAREMDFTSANHEDFLRLMGASSLIKLYIDQLRTRLLELPLYPLRSDGKLDTTSSGKQMIMGVELKIENQVRFNTNNGRNFGILSRAFDTRLKRMLNELCSIKVQPASSATAELSEQERHELKGLLSAQHLPCPQSISRDDLLAARRRALLSETSRLIGSIKTTEDIKCLFDAFKASDAYCALEVAYQQRHDEIVNGGGECSDLLTVLTMFEREFIKRIQSAESSASDSNYYGSIPLSLANDLLLESFSTMCCQNKTRVTTASMVNFFLIIAELASIDTQGNRDMSRCDRGFAGRVAAAAASLVIEGTSPLKDIELTWRIRLEDWVMNQVLRRGNESSMEFANLPYILHELGLKPKPVANDINRNEKVINDYFTVFAKVYTPAALYHEYYQAMVNNFKAYTGDEPTEEDIKNLYKLFQMLGFTSSREGDITRQDKEQLDREYRMNPDEPASKWNLCKFIDDLPGKLIETLIINKLLVPDHAIIGSQKLITLTGKKFTIPVTIEDPVVMPQGIKLTGHSGGFFPPPPTVNVFSDSELAKNPQFTTSRNNH